MSASGNGRSTTPGAIVIGGDYQGLGIVRSLGRRGVDVVILDDESSISRHSRYATGSVKARGLRDDEQTVDALLALYRSRDVEGWVVFPTREETVVALSRNRTQLLEHFRIPTPDWGVTKWAWDKRNTYERAAELGIPVPRIWRVSSEEELRRIDGEPPYVVKPAIKEHFFYATKCKAWRADSREELALRFRNAANLIGADEVVVQELIPGNGHAQLGYCAFFKEGKAHGSMVVKRLRQHPVEFGRASTFVRTVENPELEELSERFLRSIDFYGLVELEYKYDSRDGLTKLLDVNARTWGYHSVGQHAGVDFPVHALRRSGRSPSGGRDQRAAGHLLGPAVDRCADGGRGIGSTATRLAVLSAVSLDVRRGIGLQPRRSSSCTGGARLAAVPRGQARILKWSL